MLPPRRPGEAPSDQALWLIDAPISESQLRRLQGAVAEATRTGDTQAEGWLSRELGIAFLTRGCDEEAMAPLLRARRLARQRADLSLEGGAVCSIADVAFIRGCLRAATHLYLRAERLLTRAEEWRVVPYAVAGLLLTRCLRAELSLAEEAAERLCGAARKGDALDLAARSLAGAAGMLVRQQAFDAAAHYSVQSVLLIVEWLTDPRHPKDQALDRVMLQLIADVKSASLADEDSYWERVHGAMAQEYPPLAEHFRRHLTHLRAAVNAESGERNAG